MVLGGPLTSETEEPDWLASLGAAEQVCFPTEISPEYSAWPAPHRHGWVVFTGRLCFRFVWASTGGKLPHLTPRCRNKDAVNRSIADFTRLLHGVKLLCLSVPSMIPCEGPEWFQTALPLFETPSPFEESPKANNCSEGSSKASPLPKQNALERGESRTRGRHSTLSAVLNAVPRSATPKVAAGPLPLFISVGVAGGGFMGRGCPELLFSLFCFRQASLPAASPFRISSNFLFQGDSPSYFFCYVFIS